MCGFECSPNADSWVKKNIYIHMYTVAYICNLLHQIHISCCWLKSYFSLISTTTGRKIVTIFVELAVKFHFSFTSLDLDTTFLESSVKVRWWREFSEEILTCYWGTQYYSRKSQATAQVENGISVTSLKIWYLIFRYSKVNIFNSVDWTVW